MFCLLISSCSSYDKRDHISFTVEDFNEVREDTLVPNDHGEYLSFNIQVKGHVNDTSKIEIDGHFDLNLYGEIDTIIKNDYYGTETKIITFNPYRATNGNLEIRYDFW